MREAAKEYGWKLNFGEIAMIWRGGCIIRARFLHRIKEAFDRDPKLPNLLLDPFFRQVVQKAQPAWREVVATAFRSERLPANLIQAQRDYFGAHTYQRVDKPGVFHTEWTK